jgi:hypothetical protein
MNPLSPAAKAFVALMALTGAAALAYGFMHWRLGDPTQFAVWLAVAIAASLLKVKLPGVNGSMSVNLPFFLIVAAKLNIGEALAIACISSLAQSLLRSSRKPSRMVFNAATLTVGVWLAALAFNTASQHQFVLPIAIAAAAGAYFLGNTVPVALILCFAEGQSLLSTWGRIAGLTYPYYLLGASLAATVCGGQSNISWTIPLVLLVAMYFTYRSYRLYFASSSSEPKSMAKGAGN